jgi:hypothetical protein
MNMLSHALLQADSSRLAEFVKDGRLDFLSDIQGRRCRSAHNDRDESYRLDMKRSDRYLPVHGPRNCCSSPTVQTGNTAIDTFLFMVLEAAVQLKAMKNAVGIMMEIYYLLN